MNELKEIISESWNVDHRSKNKGPGLADLFCLGFRHGPPHMKKHFMCQAVTLTFFFFIYLYWNGGLVPWFLLAKQATSLKPSDAKLSVDVLKFFPEADHDGTKVIWSHGTNSKNELQAALAGPAMMIEGDIGLRGMNTANREMVAVMARPPASDSDITFDEWLDAVKSSGKGIKLDFMHIEAVELALQKLKSTQKELKVPVHISAAVLNGPNHNAAFNPPLDSVRFMRLAMTHYSRATLVLGWADAASEDDAGRYSWPMVLEMQELVEHWKPKQAVSFSVRASLAKPSLPQLRWLMEMTDKSSLTILAPEGDNVHVQDLLLVRNKLPKNRVLYDLHVTVQSQFEPIKDSGLDAIQQFRQGANVHNMEQRVAVLEDDNTFRGTQWNVAEGDKDQKVYLGTESVILQKGLLVSKKLYKAEGSVTTIFGRIEFFNMKADTAGDSGYEVFLEASRRVKQNTVSGLKCKITTSGEVSIENGDIVTKQQLGGEQECVMFNISYQPGSGITLRAIKPKSCAHMPEKLDEDSEKVVHMNMKLGGQSLKDFHIAMRQDDENSFVAVDQFRIA